MSSGIELMLDEYFPITGQEREEFKVSIEQAASKLNIEYKLKEDENGMRIQLFKKPVEPKIYPIEERIPIKHAAQKESGTYKPKKRFFLLGLLGIDPKGPKKDVIDDDYKL